MSKFGWDLPPGVSIRDIDDLTPDDCNHELCPHCDGCHIARCSAFQEPCETWLEGLEEARTYYSEAEAERRNEQTLYGYELESMLYPPIMVQWYAICAWKEELEAQHKAEVAAIDQDVQDRSKGDAYMANYVSEEDHPF